MRDSADALVNQLRDELGETAVITDPDRLAPHERDWRNMFAGRARCLLRPAGAGQVARAVALCHGAGVPIVPQGGNTGLAAAAVPDAGGGEIVMTLDRMARIRQVDPIGMLMEVEAGCVVQRAQEAAREWNCLFPVSFAAQGSATVGGIISTNAGGVNVLRYGMTRNLVLGIEVVLPDGTLVNGLRRLRKNNAGYDWKQLFIGAEGTLGIVTAAVLRLMPLPRHRVTALLEVEGPAEALDLLALAQQELGDQISAFELISPQSAALLRDHLGITVPIGSGGWLVLMDVASSIGGLRDAAMEMLAAALERETARDGVIAESEAQANALWNMREHIAEAEARAGPSAKHDVSVPIDRIPAYLDAAGQALASKGEDVAINVFGHLGDGNLHYNVLLKETGDAGRINRIVHDVVMAFDGSISAEHGVGRYRVAELEHYLPPAEMALARRLKNALDPRMTMNPGKVLRGGQG
jgi:FAD/FMN-containing dehydrogenase